MPKRHYIYDTKYRCMTCERYYEHKYLIFDKKIMCGVCKTKNSVRLQPHRGKTDSTREHYGENYID
jgi:DNA-directed RNA polymerase subunit RPC12/RpoP